MRHYSTRAPFRWQLGLLLLCLPRRLIVGARRSGGAPLALALAGRLPKLSSCGFQEPVPDPVRQGPAVLVGRSLKQALVIFGKAQL